MAAIHLLLVIVLQSGLAETMRIRVLYENEVYHGFAEPQQDNIFKVGLANERNYKDKKTNVMSLYQDAAQTKGLPLVIDIVRKRNNHPALHFVEMTDKLQPLSQIPETEWVLYYVHTINYYCGAGLKATQPTKIPVVYMISTKVGEMTTEAKGSHFSPKPERSMMLEYKENDEVKLEERISDLTAPDSEAVLFVRLDTENADWRRMTLWFPHLGSRIVGSLLSNRVFFWIQPKDSNFRFVLIATIDELNGTITIALDTSVTRFDIYSKEVIEVVDCKWSEMIRNRKGEEEFGINREVTDFYEQTTKQTLRNEDVDKWATSFAETSWSKISVVGSSVDSNWTAAINYVQSLLDSTYIKTVKVNFSDFALPI